MRRGVDMMFGEYLKWDFLNGGSRMKLKLIRLFKTNRQFAFRYVASARFNLHEFASV